MNEQKALHVRRCEHCREAFNSEWSADVAPKVVCARCKGAYRLQCGRTDEGHQYAMIYNDGETCLRCGHHKTIDER